MTSELNDEQLLRYSRQMLLPEISYDGQLTLNQSHALIIGLGGLGSPVAMYLAAAGIGQLTLVDFDEVDESNLQRQIIHTETRVGQNKAESAKQTLAELNHFCQVKTINHKLDEHQLTDLVRQVDIVLDCSDNFDTRFALNQACFQAKKPLVSGAAIRWEGQLTTYDFRQTNSPCYECLYKRGANTDQSCARNGVISPLVGMVGSMQALEAIKALVGLPTLMGKLMLIDGLTMQIRQFNLNKDSGCEQCG
jgi:adenylyltransferase/sulfurtransferase